MKKITKKIKKIKESRKKRFKRKLIIALAYLKTISFCLIKKNNKYY